MTSATDTHPFPPTRPDPSTLGLGVVGGEEYIDEWTPVDFRLGWD